MNTTLIIGLIAMAMAAIVNVLLTEKDKYCNQQNKAAYKELTIAGSVLMFLNFVFASQEKAGYDPKYLNIIAIGYVIIFFFDVIEGFRVKRNGNQQVIAADLKKSAVVIAIMYLVFGYLVS